MNKRLNKTSLRWGVPGLLIQTIAYIVGTATPEPMLAFLFLLMSLGGTVLLLIGLGYYAKAKGHSPWWGLAGLLSCIGILVLALLPDRLNEEALRIPSIDELNIPDGTQSPFGSEYKPVEPD